MRYALRINEPRKPESRGKTEEAYQLAQQDASPLVEIPEAPRGLDLLDSTTFGRRCDRPACFP